MLERWKVGLSRNLQAVRWSDRFQGQTVLDAFRRVIESAAKAVDRAKSANKRLPFEMFYALYTFTNLDTLAFEIEEALLPISKTKPAGRVLRHPDYVRRKDLIDEDQTGVKQ